MNCRCRSDPAAQLKYTATLRAKSLRRCIESSLKMVVWATKLLCSHVTNIQCVGMNHTNSDRNLNADYEMAIKLGLWSIPCTAWRVCATTSQHRASWICSGVRSSKALSFQKCGKTFESAAWRSPQLALWVQNPELCQTNGLARVDSLKKDVSVQVWNAVLLAHNRCRSCRRD